MKLKGELVQEMHFVIQFRTYYYPIYIYIFTLLEFKWDTTNL